MAIGTALAIGLGSAVIGAGASAISASKNSKAINKATDAQTASTAQNNALQANIYNQNKNTLAPFVQGGVQAGGQLNAMLGLGGAPANQNPPQTTQAQPNVNALYNGGYGDAQQYQGAGGSRFGNAFDGMGAFGSLGKAIFANNNGGSRMGMPGNITGYGSGTGGNGQQQQLPQTTAQPAQPAANPGQGFANYIGNSDFAFQQQEGMNAINSGYAGAGTIQSGAAMKGLEDYRQNLQSGYRNEYMGYLGQQQGVGLQAAGAQAGVGINYANATSANNQNQANALGQAAVAKANNSSATFGSLASIAGNAAGQIFSPNAPGTSGGGGMTPAPAGSSYGGAILPSSRWGG